MNLNKNFLYKISIAIVFIYGITVRLLALLDARPLWRDEAPIAMSIIQNSIFSLLGNILDDQKAPLLFWIETKFSQIVFGDSEIALRLLPFICSILSVFVFYILSKKYLRNKYSIIIANILFAANLRLIYFSEDLKPYSGDVLFFMLALLFYGEYINKNYTKKNLIIFLLVSLFIMFSSFPACIVIGAFITYKLINFKKDYPNKIPFYTCVAILGITSLIYYCTFLSFMFHTEMKVAHNSWAPGFISINNIHKVIINFFNYIFYPYNYSILLIILTVIGLFFILKNRTSRTKLLIISLIGIFLLSALKIYPLFQRIALYTLPVIIIIMINTIDKVKYIKNKIIKIPILCYVIIALISFYNFPKHIYSMVTDRQFKKWDGRETLKFIKDRYKSNDKIIVSKSSYFEYEYYKRQYNFMPENEEVLNFNKENKKTLYNYLNNIETGKDYWIYYSYPCANCIKPKNIVKRINSNGIEIKDSINIKKSYAWEIGKNLDLEEKKYSKF